MSVARTTEALYLRNLLRALDNCVADRALVSGFFMAHPEAAANFVLGPVQQQLQALRLRAEAERVEQQVQRETRIQEIKTLREEGLGPEPLLTAMTVNSADIRVLDRLIARADESIATLDARLDELPRMAVSLQSALQAAGRRESAADLLMDILCRAPLRDDDARMLDAIDACADTLWQGLREFTGDTHATTGAADEVVEASITGALAEFASTQAAHHADEVVELGKPVSAPAELTAK